MKTTGAFGSYPSPTAWIEEDWGGYQEQSAERGMASELALFASVNNSVSASFTAAIEWPVLRVLPWLKYAATAKSGCEVEYPRVKSNQEQPDFGAVRFTDVELKNFLLFVQKCES